MDQIPPPKEIKILETAEDIQERRQQVLSRYDNFKADARAKREKLEDSRRFQYFKRDADELESWIMEKLQAASDESYKDPTNLQVRYSAFVSPFELQSTYFLFRPKFKNIKLLKPKLLHIAMRLLFWTILDEK